MPANFVRVLRIEVRWLPAGRWQLAVQAVPSPLATISGSAARITVGWEKRGFKSRNFAGPSKRHHDVQVGIWRSDLGRHAKVLK